MIAMPCYADDDNTDISQKEYNDILLQLDKSEYNLTIDDANTLIKASNTEYTITDLYNLVYNNFYYTGNGLSSSQNIQRIEAWLRLMCNNINGSGTAVASITLRDMIQEYLGGTSDWTLAMPPLQYLASQFDTIYDGDTYVPFKDIIASICVRNIEQSDSLSVIETNTASTSNIISQVSTKISTTNQHLFDLKNNLQTIRFSNIGTYNGATLVSNGTHITSNTRYNSGTVIQFGYSVTSYNKGCWKFSIPLRANLTSDDYNITINDISLHINGIEQSNYKDKMYILPNSYGVDVYLFDFMPWSTASSTTYEFYLTANKAFYVYPNYGAIQFLSIDDYGYSLLRTALSITEIQQGVANPSKIAAEKESQDIIDETLDDFTGDGSAAPKISDIGAAKNTSSELRSGLDTGGSPSMAFSVFNNGSALWGWFSQENYNMINGSDNNRLLKSKESETPYLDFNQYMLHQIMEGAEW